MKRLFRLELISADTGAASRLAFIRGFLRDKKTNAAFVTEPLLRTIYLSFSRPNEEYWGANGGLKR